MYNKGAMKITFWCNSSFLCLRFFGPEILAYLNYFGQLAKGFLFHEMNCILIRWGKYLM